jgi:hypothetical protein
MKRAFLLPAFVAAALIANIAAPIVYGQEAPEFTPHRKSVHMNRAAAEAVQKAISSGAAVANASIPVWNYSFTAAKDGNPYTITMVGSSPFFNGSRTTNIPTVVVPIIVVLPNGSAFDPTVNDKCASNNSAVNQVMNSPVFEPAQFTMNGINMGVGQYLDQYQRASFYNDPSNVSTTGSSYHTVLTVAPAPGTGPSASPSPGATVLPAVTVSIPANEGASYNQLTCSSVAVVDYATFNSTLTNAVLPALQAEGYGTSTFIVFLLHDVVFGEPGDSLNQNCCVTGYRNPPPTSQNPAVQQYVVADYDTSGVFNSEYEGITNVSGEIADWMTDPLSVNTTPTWGDIGNVSTCVNEFDVTGPLIGWTVTSTGGSVPQYPFFSWFYGGSSIGASGVYSDGGVLTVPAHTCGT